FLRSAMMRAKASRRFNSAFTWSSPCRSLRKAIASLPASSRACRPACDEVPASVRMKSELMGCASGEIRRRHDAAVLPPGGLFGWGEELDDGAAAVEAKRAGLARAGVGAQARDQLAELVPGFAVEREAHLGRDVVGDQHQLGVRQRRQLEIADLALHQPER